MSVKVQFQVNDELPPAYSAIEDDAVCAVALKKQPVRLRCIPDGRDNPFDKATAVKEVQAKVHNVPPKEVERLHDLFSKHAEQGKLSREKFAKLVEQWGVIDAQQANEYFTAFDKSGDNSIDMREFLTGCVELCCVFVVLLHCHESRIFHLYQHAALSTVFVLQNGCHCAWRSGCALGSGL